MKLYYEVKDTYGTKRIYPACKNSQLFANLANTKTFTGHMVGVIKQLGYTFERKYGEIELEDIINQN